MQDTIENTVVSDREDLVSYIWDIYKEINGVRPRWVNFDSMSYDELNAWAGRLAVEAEEAHKQHCQQLAADVQAFEDEVQLMLAMGAGSRANALRWMADAADAADSSKVEHWLWQLGLIHYANFDALRDEIVATL